MFAKLDTDVPPGLVPNSNVQVENTNPTLAKKNVQIVLMVFYVLILLRKIHAQKVLTVLIILKFLVRRAAMDTHKALAANQNVDHVLLGFIVLILV